MGIYVGDKRYALYTGSTRREILLSSEPISYIDWLKSMGCITWLPLSSEGDLLDRITGLSLQLTGNGSFTWDATAGMYKVKTGKKLGQYAAFLDNGMNAASFPNNCFTTLSCFQKITTTGYVASTQFSPISTTSTTIASFSPFYGVGSNVSNYPDDLLKLARYQGTDGRISYYDGAINTEDATVQTTYIPSSWVLTGNGLALGIVREAKTTYTNKEYYNKDIYIFTRKLTLEIIRQIQGYDPLPSNVIV